jgi:glycosyltransferase involved in cell wall biosynthesis
MVEQFFHPDGWGGAQLPRDLAMHFARQGWRVEVICGTEQYTPSVGHDQPDPRAVGVVIHRIPALPGGGELRKRKLLRQLWFCCWAALRLLVSRPPDIYISLTNPPLAMPLVTFVARVWRRPMIVIAMDLYPEVLIEHGLLAKGGTVARAVAGIFAWSYRSACAVIALGPSMADRIRAKGVPDGRVIEISNWATGDLGVVRGTDNPMRTVFGLGDDFVLVYSGNLGLGHEFDTLLQGVAVARRQVPSLRVLFFGSGARLEEVRKLVASLGLDCCTSFAPPVPGEQLPQTLGLADLGIVTLRAGFQGLMVPSKLLGYMARGIPVLYIGPPGDASGLLSRHQCGFCVRNGDAEGVAQAILEAWSGKDRLGAMGSAGRRAYESSLSSEHALSRYQAVLQDCLESGRRRVDQ